VILVDANILLYAEDRLSAQHDAAREWWDAQLSGAATVGLCWTVITAFIRIGTNRRVFTRPLSIEEAVGRVQSWLDQPGVRILQPTENHWSIFSDLLMHAQAAANLAMDAHLATLAIEHGCELCSTDQDFARFPKLKWRNPLTPTKGTKPRAH
jgi:toxin-antitoxin system PIN domain toxin